MKIKIFKSHFKETHKCESVQKQTNKQKTPKLKPLQFKTIKNNYNSKQKKTGQWL